MNYRIGFATCEAIPDLTETEKKFTEFVKEQGIVIEPVIWSNRGIDYSRFDLIVIRSCWDYHLRFEEFLGWLNFLEEQNVNVLNSIKTMKRNINKFYLRELQQKGVKILDTVFVNKESPHKLTDIFAFKKWSKAVIKPAVSASANRTFIVSGENIDMEQNLLEGLLEKSDVLIQQFAEEINSEGEWSLMFFNKKYSHSVLKQPKENDFRVQVEHGGSYFLKEAPKEIIRQASSVMDTVKNNLLYARVDGVVVNGEFRLMELELIEPEIFLLNHNIMKEFANAIIESLKK